MVAGDPGLHASRSVTLGDPDGLRAGLRDQVLCPPPSFFVTVILFPRAPQTPLYPFSLTGTLILTRDQVQRRDSISFTHAQLGTEVWVRILLLYLAPLQVFEFLCVSYMQALRSATGQ